MCGLFGLINYGKVLDKKDINIIVKHLAIESAARGKHATGIAQYVPEGKKLKVTKAPVPAYKVTFDVPETATAVMGHTRHATHGSAKDNYNNHPFLGKTGMDNFALAHNGVLWNDVALQFEYALPVTKIKTDSYVAVQLLEKQGALDMASLKWMAEQVEGSYTFTVFDDRGVFYVIRGDNPFAMLHFKKLGFYVYASTDEILWKALIKTHMLGVIKEAFEKPGQIKSVDLTEGEILKINTKGHMSRSTFTVRKACAYNVFGKRWYEYGDDDYYYDDYDSGDGYGYSYGYGSYKPTGYKAPAKPKTQAKVKGITYDHAECKAITAAEFKAAFPTAKATNKSDLKAAN